MGTDILILPEDGNPWVLSLQDGEVVRLSFRKHAHQVGRTYFAKRVYCGGKKDKPIDLKRMDRAYAAERKMNA